MRARSLLALSFLIVGCLALFAALEPQTQPREASSPAKEQKLPPVLPGLLQDGSVQLPNQWKLTPAGRQIEVGDLPVNIAIHPSGQYLAVLDAGFQEHEIVIIALERTRQKIVSRVTLDQTYIGMAFSADGKKLYASGGEFSRIHEFEFSRGLLGNPKIFELEGAGGTLVIGGIAVGKDGKDLFAAGTWGDVIFRMPLENPDNKVTIKLARSPSEPGAKEKPKGDPPSPPDGRKEEIPVKGKKKSPDSLPVHPYTCLPDRDGKFLFVSLWAGSSVAVIDLEKNEVVRQLPTASHPTEMVISPDGGSLYVACANSTQVNVFDLALMKPSQTINCALYVQAPSGNTPTSLCITPDGQLLFVANADANNLAVFNIANGEKAKPLGFIPTGWYPTSVRYNAADKKIYVANGKGMSSKANPYGPNPNLPIARNLGEYIGMLFHGTISTINVPTPEQMGKYSKQAYANSPLKSDFTPLTDGASEENAIPKKIGAASPIKHVIYIIKENRTYDQVFGDLKQGNGAPQLCLFPDAITPNHHQLASQFVLLDNFYVDGEVSADGHEWSMGAYASDYVEKSWPLSYRGSPKKAFGYPSEGALDYLVRPAGGYIWDRAAEAKVSYRSYGEWINNSKKNADGTFEDCKPSVKALEGHFDPQYRAYDLDYPDVKRAERFISELQRFEKEGDMPQLQIVKLGNDHTSGTRVGKPTPTAQVADNDLALGLLVEAVSNSKFWKDTAIFVLEDDTQNGPDHVDAHRCPALVISPYTKHAHVDSTMYSTSSMLRTMELILGLQPMSQYDAAARPMYNSFTFKPDMAVYKHRVPKTDLNEKNLAGAWGAEWSQRANLEKEDQADERKLNRVIWKSVKGAASEMPAPVRAAFYKPNVKKDVDDDDDD